MPSTALLQWQNDRTPRLESMNAHCIVLQVQPHTQFFEVSLHAFVMLLSGHFQGFCRDLYTECAQLCAAAVSGKLQTTLQAQFLNELKLDKNNPTLESIRGDFERFGFELDLDQIDHKNPQRITHLGLLNKWRNHVAHQKASPLPSGVPGPLTLVDIQTWRNSCNGLAISLDDKMEQELTQILGKSPW